MDAGDLTNADGPHEVAETDGASDAADAGAASDADVTPSGPRIVSISPAPGAKGVRADANIVVTFDRPMDKSRTSQAYQSTDVPVSAANLTWNTQATQLTINPSTDLQYAGGVVMTTPEAIPPRSYSFRITAAAQDATGKTLQQPVSSSFTTLRRLAQGLVAKGDAVLSLSSLNETLPCTEGRVSFTAVKYMGRDRHKILVTFGISVLPAGVVNFEAASLGANQVAVMDGSYSTGSVIAEHVREPLPIGDFHTGYSQVALRPLGTFSTNANYEYKSVDVLAALVADYTARRQHSQYRLDNTFAPQGGYGYAGFSCDLGFHLATVYLVP
ncbi:MAG TPA: Ig-like domain-containing protein [Polyangiaceae bacterium]